ncbi:MAG: HAMP domain-containing histidine kinase [Dactylosporangium sp.]|nr:HAMP domain-containing histidine kinase [Dactylosporangium sp.]NNJ61162.1 HAMP domain-containing histidine kinase [Dactylosporangium sp.]
MLGCPVTDHRALIPPWDGGPLICEFDQPALGGDTRCRLAGTGLRRLVRAVAVAEGRYVGCFALGYPQDAAPRLTPAQRSAIGLLAACAASVYARDSGDCRSREQAAGWREATLEEDHSLFIAVTSHELRTPLTVIRGYADTLAEHWEQLDDARRRAAISVVRHRAKDLARLLDRLLSAAGDGGSVGALAAGVPFDLLEAIRYAVDELPVDLRSHLALYLPVELPKAFGDRGTIATIVTELVTNACKYSEGRGEVDLAAGTDCGGVWLTVADRGVGIRPEHTERAFERFWQGERRGLRGRGGVGLGLYLVRRIVERHKGWVSLRPRDGGGTLAEVRLLRADTILGGA